ncbi:MAG: type II toxin-antitoxin system HicA family toxin [Chloroflexi bacterium]|nr:type II toxin-antitoxin system HicA family toxin [Chloroflexota bacterium]
MDPAQLLQRLSRGELRNVAFADLIRLVEALGFELDRQTGNHRIYRHPHHAARLNLQPPRREAKDYQLRQLLTHVEDYDLHLGDQR